MEIVTAAVATPGKRGPDSATGYLRRRGRDFIISFYGTLRAIKLYPLEHTAVQRSLAELTAIAREIMPARKGQGVLAAATEIGRGGVQFTKRASGQAALRRRRLGLALSNY